METIFYPASAVERAMKVQEVILRAIEGRLKWYHSAEILLEISATINPLKLASIDPAFPKHIPLSSLAQIGIDEIFGRG